MTLSAQMLLSCWAVAPFVLGRMAHARVRTRQTQRSLRDATTAAAAAAQTAGRVRNGEIMAARPLGVCSEDVAPEWQSRAVRGREPACSCSVAGFLLDHAGTCNMLPGARLWSFLLLARGPDGGNPP